MGLCLDAAATVFPGGVVRVARGASQPLLGDDAGMGTLSWGHSLQERNGCGTVMASLSHARPSCQCSVYGSREGLGQMPPHVGARVGFAFSYMHSSIRPHGPAPVCAHLGSLCVELGVQDMPGGSRRRGKHP